MGGYSTCSILLLYIQMGSRVLKTERINVRTTKQLKEKITKIADEKGVPVPELIDNIILNDFHHHQAGLIKAVLEGRGFYPNFQ